MTDLIVIAVVLAAVGSAALYIYRKKKSGVKCIGCASGHKCGGCHCEGAVESCGCSRCPREDM